MHPTAIELASPSAGEPDEDRQSGQGRLGVGRLGVASHAGRVILVLLGRPSRTCLAPSRSRKPPRLVIAGTVVAAFSSDSGWATLEQVGNSVTPRRAIALVVAVALIIRCRRARLGDVRPAGRRRESPRTEHDVRSSFGLGTVEARVTCNTKVSAWSSNLVRMSVIA